MQGLRFWSWGMVDYCKKEQLMKLIKNPDDALLLVTIWC